MEVVLLGTGSARGWPEPGCRCASCATAAAQQASRGPTAVLVDDVLLLDVPQAGRDLAQVRTVLLSGAQAAAPTGAVEVLGPPAAQQHPGERPVAPGDEAAVGRHVVRALAQGGGLAWEVTGPDGSRLLYAPGAGPVDGARGPHDLLLLGLAGLPATLARLRASGPAAPAVAVGIGHGSGPPEALLRDLAAWGATAPPDGTVLHVRAGSAPAPDPLRGRTLVLGGVRSGKSALAERLLAASPRVTYVATGGTRAGDPEWQERVAAHVARRPDGWRTVETTDVAGCLRDAADPLLVDCLGTWLTARLDAHGVWEGGPLAPVEQDVAELIAAWRAAAVPVVAVSNEVGSGVVPATASGRLFRDLLGSLNARVAAESETVLLTVAGLAVPLRSP